MKNLALRSAAVVATASTATLFTLFLEWRGRVVRRITGESAGLRRAGEEPRADDDLTPPEMTSHEIDDALADSFPASDPPAWTPGVARLTPRPGRLVTVGVS